MKLVRWLALIFALMPSLAWAQAGVTTYPAPWGQTGYTTLAVSSSSANVALPGNLTNGSIANVCNIGTTDGFALLGNSSVTAAVTNVRVPAGGCVPLNPVGQTTIAGITATGTTTFAISVGQGTPFSSLPGGSGGGSADIPLGGQLSGTTGNATVNQFGPSVLAHTAHDEIVETDGQTTAGSPVFYSPTAVFTAADVGKAIVFNGAGSGGADLITTIAALVDANHVTMAANASTTKP